MPFPAGRLLRLSPFGSRERARSARRAAPARRLTSLEGGLLARLGDQFELADRFLAD